MICFQISIFEPLETAKVVKEPFFILVRAESPEAAIEVGNGVGDEEAPSSETVSATKTKFTGVVVMTAPKKEPAKPKAEAPKEEEQPKTPAKAAKSKKK